MKSAVRIKSDHRWRVSGIRIVWYMAIPEMPAINGISSVPETASSGTKNYIMPNVKKVLIL